MKKLEPRKRDVHVFVCHGSRCTRNGAPLVRRGLVRELSRLGVRSKASRTGCQGFCKQGCVVFVERPRTRVWGRVREEDLARLARKLVRGLGKAARGSARDRDADASG